MTRPVVTALQSDPLNALSASFGIISEEANGRYFQL
jgi:hypothetical protein